MLKLLKRIVVFAVFIEVFYFIVVNAALSMAVTQTVINKIRPAKFQITWEKAWTPYPFKVFIQNAAVWGGSLSQRWKVTAVSASASINLIPLLKHKVEINNIEAVNVGYFQRPQKVKSSEVVHSAYYPPMDPAAASKTKKKGKKPWTIELRNISAKGHHTLWIYFVKGDIDGGIDIDTLSIETKKGPFLIDNGKVNVLMKTLQVAEDKNVLSNSEIKGNIDIGPIIFSKNKGMKMLEFFSFDTDIISEMGNLKILNVYLDRYKNTNIQGKGKLDGHIHFEKGKLLPETDIKISADNLALSILNYVVRGEGEISLNIDKNTSEVLNANVLFDTLHTYVSNDNNSSEEIQLFTGSDLALSSKSSIQLYPVPAKKDAFTSVLLDIPMVKVPDLSVYQRYIPKQWSFYLLGGRGEFKARAEIGREHLSMSTQLVSKEAKVRLSKDDFKTNLDIFLKADISTEKEFKANLSGSYLSLTDSVVFDAKKTKKRSRHWDTRLDIVENTFSFPLPNEGNMSKKQQGSLKKYSLKELFNKADAILKIKGSISQFDWLNFILKSSLGLNFSGSGTLSADLRLKEGILSEKSKVSFTPHNMEIGLLDYILKGDGQFLFSVTEGGERPSMHFDLGLNDAFIRRRHEKQTMVEHATVNLSGKILKLDLNRAQKEVDIHLKVPSAKIKNMTAYNSYFPPKSPFKFTGGTADISSDILLKPNHAKGFVKLKTKALTMKVDDQKISARLNMDINIAGGVPRKMQFNIAGSSIVLDKAKVIGATSTYVQPDWSAEIKVKNANITWKKPLRFRSQSSIKIKDSRPIVAMINNKREKDNWLSKMMTIENIKGTAAINMANNVITFPSVFATSDKVNIGIKGIISPALRDAVIYFRYKHMKALLKIRNGKKNLDIFHTEKKYNDYKIPVK
jgi:hypothetical protein